MLLQAGLPNSIYVKPRPGSNPSTWFSYQWNWRSWFNSSFAVPRPPSKKIHTQEFFKSQNQIVRSKGSKLIALKITPNAVFSKWPQSNHIFQVKEDRSSQAEKARSHSFILQKFSRSVFSSSTGEPRGWTENETKAGPPSPPYVVDPSTA